MGTFSDYCTICGKQFVKWRPFHKVCSDRCRKIKTERNHYGYKIKEDVTKKCKHCGNEFVSNNKKKVYCCDQCAVAYNLEHRIKTEKRTCVCEVCQTEFETTHHSKKYCCTECYIEAKRRRK